MDSGNCSRSSMQSSSSGGGDNQEFNSQALDSVSSFLNNPYSSHFLPTLNYAQPSFPSPQLTTAFDNTTSKYVQSSFPQSQPQPNLNPNPAMNIGSDQARGVRFDQPVTAAYRSQSTIQTQSAGAVQIGNARASSSADQQTTRVVRNTKKRTRASRRAPTTVLTTDTTNFRAMVQEFTGVPEPPFSGTRRLDLFGYGSSSAPSFRPANQPTGTLYPANVQQFVNNTPVNPTGNFPNNAASISSTTNSSNLYQHPSELNMPRQAQHMLSMQNQNQSLSSQPLLQSSFPSSFNVTSFSTMSQLGSAAAAPTFMNQELGSSHGHVNYAGFSGMQSHADGSYNRNQDH